MNPKHAGQIVRINLENFMSYDNIELYPGHHLNLIIGPNGTGKSSIVCAVLLCLGGKLKTLGRADQLSSYIKAGCNQSCIEIELHEPKGSNITIKRKILSNNQSEFWINGKISNATKVNEIKKNYNIQIDNLCTFLPQEKVQDFAKLNSQQLLDQTQKTIGNGNLVQLHETLKDLQSKILNQEKHCSVLQVELEKEIQKNERLKDQVNCFKKKQSLFDKLTVLNQKLAWVTYEQEIESKKEIDKDTALAKQSYMEKKKCMDQYEKELLEFDRSLNSQQKQLNDVKKIEAGKEAAMQDRLRRAEQRVDRLEDLKNVLQARLEEEREKKKEMVKFKENIEKLTNDLKNLDANVGAETDFNIEVKEADNRFKKIHAEEDRLNQLRFNLEESEDALKQEARNVAAEYQNLKHRQNVRLEYLKKNEPDVYKSIEWLEKNRHLFQSRIYNPMLLELNVPNSKMAKFIESRIGYKDLISFCCTNPDDLNLLVQKLRGEQKWKVNAICSDECDSSQYFAEIPLSDLRPYGFHAYMKDFITGPEDIIRFLCKTYKIHCIPIGDESVKSKCGKVPQGVPIFYSENHVFSVKYSVYSGDKSINVKKLGEARFFVESLDNGRTQFLINRGKDLEVKLEKKRTEINNVEKEIRDLRIELENVKKKRKELATSAQERQLIQMNLKRASNNYKAIEETLKQPAEIEKESSEQQQTLKKEIQRNLADLNHLCEEYQNVMLTRQKCELKYNISKLGRRQILDNKSICTEEISRKETLFREMKERQRAAEYKCKQLKDKAKQLTDNVSNEDEQFQTYKKLFSKLPKTPEELEAEIEDIRAQSEFLEGGNIKVLEEYEKREEKIAQLKSGLECSKKNLEEKIIELNSKKCDWLNPVNELLTNINDNFGKYFEAMGCAGEVSLVTGENKDDFEKYGIKIKVKFRDGTPLEELGRYFQSGGERAVATAIFMLSLQELTSVPFRFVDEINQGMDPINERRILQIIVKVTSQTNSSQYFFITPKLLPDLNCSNTMTVHCIHNGPNAFPASKWDMKRFLEFENLDDLEYG